MKAFAFEGAFKCILPKFNQSTKNEMNNLASFLAIEFVEIFVKVNKNLINGKMK